MVNGHMRRKHALLRVLVAACISGAGSAAIAGDLAAVPITMTPIYTNTAIGLGMIDAARRASERAYGADRPASPARPAGVAGTPANFAVPNDPVISARAKAAFLNTIRANNSPRIAATIEATFNRKPVRVAFLEAAAPYGIGDRDMRDVLAAYMTVAWMTANQAPLPARAQVQGLRSQVARTLSERAIASDPNLRQLAAEQMMYQVVATIYARQEAEQAHDSAGLKQMADASTLAFQRQNLNLRALRLTDRGFEPL